MDAEQEQMWRHTNYTDSHKGVDTSIYAESVEQKGINKEREDIARECFRGEN